MDAEICPYDDPCDDADKTLRRFPWPAIALVNRPLAHAVAFVGFELGVACESLLLAIGGELFEVTGFGGCF